MANIILKLIPNKWDEKHFFSFIKKSDKIPKDQHFLAHNNRKKEIQAGDFWECFIWSKRELEDKILYKVIPYAKVSVENLKEERKRVSDFNRVLANMEKFIGEDFEKVIYLPDNKPFLQAKIRDKSALSLKYPDFLFLEEGNLLLASPPAPKPPKRFGSAPRQGGKFPPPKGFNRGGASFGSKPMVKPELNPLYNRFKNS
jgi:hypothetical protein